jgi:hypothetical protein
MVAHELVVDIEQTEHTYALRRQYWVMKRKIGREVTHEQTLQHLLLQRPGIEEARA